MYYLYETASGLALFKAEKGQAVQPVTFHAFETIQQAFEEQKQLLAGELTAVVQEFVKKNFMQSFKGETLGVADAHLAQALKDQFGIAAVCNDMALQVHRDVQRDLFKLLPKLNKERERQYSASLAHNFSRYQIQFNSESIDSMILQSVNLFDESEKEINNYVMRLMEWAVWSFPECAKIVTDHRLYSKAMALIGADKKALLNPEVIKELKAFLPSDDVDKLLQMAQVSVGTEIMELDAQKVRGLAREIEDLYQAKEKMAEYIAARMVKIAPNFSAIVGPIIGAKLLSKAGSLLKLAKAPASTIQILGAEATLFKALKQNSKTPKYGFLYNCELVAAAPMKEKGKVARKVAQNAAICVRYDALHEGELDQTLHEQYLARCSLDGAQKQKIVKQEKLKAFAINQAEMKAKEECETVNVGVVDKAEEERKAAEKAAKKAAKKAVKEAAKQAAGEEKAEEKPAEEKKEKDKEEKKEKKHKDKDEKKEKDKEEKPAEEKKEKKHKDKKEKKDKE